MFRNSKRTSWIHLKTRMISNTAKGLDIESMGVQIFGIKTSNFSIAKQSFSLHPDSISYGLIP